MPGQVPATVVGHAVLVGVADLAAPGPFAPLPEDQRVLAVPAEPGGAPVAWGPSAPGVLTVPAHALGRLEPLAGARLLGIAREGAPPEAPPLGYRLEALAGPGRYTLLWLGADGGAYRTLLQVGSVDLALDADNDSAFATAPATFATPADEALEDLPQGPGKLLGVGRGDSDGDGIADGADGFDANGRAGDADDRSPHRLVPVRVRLDLGPAAARATIRFTYPGASRVEVITETHRVPWQEEPVRLYRLPEPAPALRLWSADGPAPRRAAPWDPEADPLGADGPGRYLAPGIAYPVGALFPPGTPERLVYLEALTESAAPGDRRLVVTVELPTEPPSPPARLTDAVRLTAVGVDLALYSRNDLTRPLTDPAHELWEDVEPFVFWVNDDEDGCSREDPVTEAVTGCQDYEDTRVNGARDLVDLAPFAVTVPTVIPPGRLPEGWAYRLVFRHRTEGGAAVRVFPNPAFSTSPELDREAWPYAYLRTPTGAQAQQSVSALFDGGTGGVVGPLLWGEGEGWLPPEALGEGGWIPLTLEGVQAGTGQLALELVDTGRDDAVVAADTAWIELPAAPRIWGARTGSVHGLLSEWNLRGPSWDDDLPVREREEWLREPPAATRDGALQYIFYVHGYNEDPEDTRWRKFGPVFKRLYWAGVRVHPHQGGLFVGVHWPGSEGSVLEQAWYNNDVFHAFYAGDRLGEALERRFGGRSDVQVHLVAHSLGSLVVGQALQWLAERRSRAVDAAFVLEGAVTAAAFDSGSYRAAERPNGRGNASGEEGGRGGGPLDYATDTGYAPPGSGKADQTWRTRWEAPGGAFAGALACERHPETLEYLSPYCPWEDDTWRRLWAEEAGAVLEALSPELPAGVDPARHVYTTRWTNPYWGGDHDPWAGILGAVVGHTPLHNFTTAADEGEAISQVLRWWPEAPMVYKDVLPLGSDLPAWRLNQSRGRPETHWLLGSDDDDPDGGDPWDEDLRDNPHRVEAGVIDRNDPAEVQRCRHRAELAHYFNELAMPVAVNPIAGPKGDVTNHEIKQPETVMKGLHDYFVKIEEYHLLYPVVWAPMAGDKGMLRASEGQR
ncbi:MAG: hypothetical protein Kow0092_39890 [Deferrisomatales bacterium]